jgi:hypothetical protein
MGRWSAKAVNAALPVPVVRLSAKEMTMPSAVVVMVLLDAVALPAADETSLAAEEVADAV